MSTPIPEPLITLHWLNSILVPDPVLSAGLTGKWHQVVPAGTNSPYGIVRQETASEDLTGLVYPTPNLIAATGIWQVNLYDREVANYSRISPLASRVYELLQAASAAGIIWCRRLTVRADYESMGDVVERFIEQRFEIGANGVQLP